MLHLRPISPALKLKSDSDRLVKKRSDPDGIAGRVTWIYSRPEVIGHKTEIDEVILNESGAKVPTYERVEVMGVVEFHLHFQDAKLVNWQRIVPRSRSF